jgi:hypothetical protein
MVSTTRSTEAMAVTKKAKTAKKTKTATDTPARGAKAATSSKRAAGRATAKKTATAKTTSASRTAAPKKSTAVKLNDRQREYLKKIGDAGVTGYEAGPSYEQRTIDALVDRKLVKRGAKDKQSGKHRFMLTKSGEKQLTTPPPPATTS